MSIRTTQDVSASFAWRHPAMASRLSKLLVGAGGVAVYIDCGVH